MSHEPWEEKLKRLQSEAPSEKLRARILQEAADAPFVTCLRGMRPAAPSADLRGRILAAADLGTRRRLWVGRFSRIAAVALIALSVPVNSWIEGRAFDLDRGAVIPRPAAAASAEQPETGFPATRLFAQSASAGNWRRYLHHRTETSELVFGEGP